VTSQQEYSEYSENIARLAVISLRRTISPRDSEMQRSSDWIEVDPVFNKLRESSSNQFKTFRNEQLKKDYPSAP
jgi:hypothetical protein